MSAAHFDLELIRRYDTPGPRYTSYPTAPQFSSDFNVAQLREQARIGNAEADPRRLSLYMHVPYCFSPCFYCGCNRIITRDASKGRVYVGRLAREIEMAAKLFDRGREVIQLHLGGGTPNFLAPHDIDILIAVARRNFTFSAAADRDFSIEIDPRFMDARDIAAYGEMGFNRASIGIQDFDEAVQLAVNRVQSSDDTAGIIEACRVAGFRSVNVDLIYGLPRQTLPGFARTLDTVIAMRPDRLAIYAYAHLPQMFKAQRQIDANDLPDAETKLALLQLAIAKLSAAGYLYIGMDHFALPSDELARAQDVGTLHRNFMGYTTQSDTDLIAVGVSAISHVGRCFSQNPRDLAAWEAAVDRGELPAWRGVEMTSDDVVRADVIQQLMCQGAVDIAATARRHGIDFAAYFATSIRKLQPLIDDGLVRLADGKIKASTVGRLMLRRIAMCFDNYLPPIAPPR